MQRVGGNRSCKIFQSSQKCSLFAQGSLHRLRYRCRSRPSPVTAPGDAQLRTKLIFTPSFKALNQPGAVTGGRRPGMSGRLSLAAERPQGLPPPSSPQLQIPGHGDPNPPRPEALCQQAQCVCPPHCPPASLPPSPAEVVVPAVFRPAEGGRVHQCPLGVRGNLPPVCRGAPGAPQPPPVRKAAPKRSLSLSQQHQSLLIAQVPA